MVTGNNQIRPAVVKRKKRHPFPCIQDLSDIVWQIRRINVVERGLNLCLICEAEASLMKYLRRARLTIDGQIPVQCCLNGTSDRRRRKARGCTSTVLPHIGGYRLSQ